MKRKLFALAILGMAFAFTTQAQDNETDDHTVQIEIPEVAILDLEASSSTSITLSVTAPTEAGLPVSFSDAKDSSVWINYSSIVGSTTEASRTVAAKISSGTVPGGMLLKVTAAADAGNGDGTVGSSAGQITLSSSDQTVVSSIGSCYTGDGASNGHNLYYSLELDPSAGSYANIDFDDATTLTILYTISNN
ncbi:MAG: hypothetical protein H6608_10865 [Flavobacteriales bacterium]|nr:hypothetical protein [Bacteroidota bacterium]MCB9241627.1 hypothetical protein [Flavobacteriales bacterium]